MRVSRHVVGSALGLMFAGLVAGGANAQSPDPSSQRQDIKQDKKDIRNDKKDLSKDRADRNSDQKDINADKRDIKNDKKDVRQDNKDINSDKRDVHDLAAQMLNAGYAVATPNYDLCAPATLRIIVQQMRRCMMHLHGNAAQISVEIGRGSVPSDSQPSFAQLEEALTQIPAEAA